MTLTLSTRIHSSSSFASMSPCAPMPALAITMSRRPAFPTTRAMASRTLASSPMSQSTPVCGASTASGLRSSAKTRAPCEASSSAIARPRPEAPPVTAATSPSKWDMGSPCRSRADSGRGTDDGAVLAQSLDAEFDDVAGCEVGEAARQSDTLRCSGVDEVSGLQHHEAAEAVHDLGDAEDEVAGG